MQIKVDLNNARYLKLVTDKNSDSWWAEWYDETVFADAKLLTNDYQDTDATEPVEFIKTVQQYDEEIKNYVSTNQTNTENYELALLQREFVNNFGYDVLLDFVHCKDEYKDTVKWLMTNLTNMKLYIYGGEPDGNYIASMKALNDDNCFINTLCTSCFMDANRYTRKPINSTCTLRNFQKIA